MRIVDTYGRFNVGHAHTAKNGAAAGSTPKTDAGNTKEAASSGSDPVTVSPQALELAQKASAAADTAKVEQLHGAIQNGTLQIDRQAIAKRIVDGG
jgi:flagellar biosynthesis anti-sigma factor FlgM